MVVRIDRPFRLLITDDSNSFRATLREVLEERPYLELLEAESGEQAVEVVREVRIDIVLLDMHMHIMTGLDTLKVMKQLDAIRPCILITSDATEELKRDAREAHAFSVLRKPVPRRDLVTTISDALISAYDVSDPASGLPENRMRPDHGSLC